MTTEPALALAAALAIDLAVGEPPNALHPVAWLGHAVSAALRLSPRRSEAARFVFGVVLALVFPLGAAALGLAVERLGTELSPFVGFVLQVYALKSAFAVKALGGAAEELARTLRTEGLEAARPLLRSLCSRDPSSLDESGLATGAVESLAENASDSVVAPLFYLVLFGLPGALFYRAVNTLDAMVGYRGEYEWLGKASARLDDALNLVPARLTALLLLVSGALLGLDARRGLRILLRDGGKTESPNAGRPMATAAGLLGVVLDKPGAYALGDADVRADVATIEVAWRLVRLACILSAALALAALLLHG